MPAMGILNENLIPFVVDSKKKSVGESPTLL